MKITIYSYVTGPLANPDHDMVLADFARGLEKLGLEYNRVPFGSHLSSEVPDYAVMFGTYKKGVPMSISRKEIMDRQAEHGKQTIIIDSGYVKRSHYYMVGIGGLNGRADFRLKEKMPGDRWEQLGVKLQPWREESKANHILVCGQVPWDASVQHTNHIGWLQQTVAHLTGLTERTILFSRHPLSPENIFIDGVSNINIPNLDLWLKGCHATVCFNSNSGVESLIAGVPTFSFDEGSMVWGLSRHNLNQIEEPLYPERDEWANRIAYCQWTTKEMALGLAQRHILGLD